MIRSLVQKAEYLFKLEEGLQKLFKKEVLNVLSIGAILKQIKDKKLYRYKDTNNTYNWLLWTKEFLGSHDTANRYVALYEAFAERHSKFLEKVGSIPLYKLYEITPFLLKEGTTEKEAGELIALAEASPSIQELRAALKQKNIPLEELTVDGGHTHKMMHRHYLICQTCEKTQPCSCPKIETHKDE